MARRIESPTQPLAVSVKTIQQLDKVAIEKYGVPSIALMENAGREAARFVQGLLKNKNGKKVCIVCGTGNNAGDGFVCARHLLNAGRKVKILLIGQGSKLKEDAAINYGILRNLKFPIKEFKRINGTVVRDLKESDVVVDAIFGVGLNRPVLDPYRSTIEAINNYADCVVSVDVPSGLNATTGEIFGCSVRADHTVTFTFAKKGFFIKKGPKHVGKVIVVDIGIPLRLLKRIG